MSIEFINGRSMRETLGWLHIRWDLGDPLVILEIRGANGKIMTQHTLRLNSTASIGKPHIIPVAEQI